MADTNVSGKAVSLSQKQAPLSSAVSLSHEQAYSGSSSSIFNAISMAISHESENVVSLSHEQTSQSDAIRLPREQANFSFRFEKTESVATAGEEAVSLRNEQASNDEPLEEVRNSHIANSPVSIV